MVPSMGLVAVEMTTLFGLLLDAAPAVSTTANEVESPPSTRTAAEDRREIRIGDRPFRRTCAMPIVSSIWSRPVLRLRTENGSFAAGAGWGKLDREQSQKGGLVAIGSLALGRARREITRGVAPPACSLDLT
jgi:hypothetical protein